MEPRNDDWPIPSAERLRAALEPPAGLAERLVRRALRAEAGPGRGWPGPFRFWAALASAAALAGLLLLALPRPSSLEGRGSGREPGARVSISNEGSIVIARRPESAAGWLIHSGPPAPLEPSQIVVVRHGEKP